MPRLPRLVRSGLIPLSFVALGLTPPVSQAEPVLRIDHVPGGGLVGDLWTFRCPPGGTVEVSVDTFGDVPLEDDSFASALDPAIAVFDARGNLIAQGDDEAPCTTASLCDGQCPAVTVSCGTGIRHSIVVRDSGLLPGCEIGGSYLLNVEVFNATGASRPAGQVRLGGGPARQVPQFVLNEVLIGRSGPVVDNGPVPLLVPFSPSGVEGAQSRALVKDTSGK